MMRHHVPQFNQDLGSDQPSSGDAQINKALQQRRRLAVDAKKSMPRTPCHAAGRVRLWNVKTMKVTVELSDYEMAEILDLTGERKKGPAIRRLMAEALQQRRRAQIAQRFLSGEWGVELESFEADQQRDRQREQELVL